MDMSRRGRKRQLVVEDEYWALILAGVGTVDACRQTGITRKTGYRWRLERGGVPSARLTEEQRSGRYLSLLERQRIAALRARGLTIREIAARLSRAPSTVSRELHRNLRRHDRDIYDATLADARARHRAKRSRGGRLLHDLELRTEVQGKLLLEWSPQQIAAWLRLEFPDKPTWHVCHETIYQALYSARKGGLSMDLTKRRRTDRPLRKRRRRPNQRAIRFITPSQLIDARPAIVDDRDRLGDWEGDMFVGRLNQSAIGTVVDRMSRFVHLVHIPSGHTAEAFAAALSDRHGKDRTAARLTLTWDQGSEMARHDLIADQFTDGVYFAHPGRPWLRGTNENMNGLIRQYFTKGDDLSLFIPEDLRRVEELLNNRPRRILGWRTPAQVFTANLPN